MVPQFLLSPWGCDSLPWRVCRLNSTRTLLVCCALSVLRICCQVAIFGLPSPWEHGTLPGRAFRLFNLLSAGRHAGLPPSSCKLVAALYTADSVVAEPPGVRGVARACLGAGQAPGAAGRMRMLLGLPAISQVCQGGQRRMRGWLAGEGRGCGWWCGC